MRNKSQKMQQQYYRQGSCSQDQQQQYYLQSYQSSLSQHSECVYNNNHTSTQQNSTNQKPIKMIQFIDSLYQKYKILNKLSQQQSNNFQTQIITMLMDQNQCLDKELYQSTVSKIGLSTFILQVLASVIAKKTIFHNHYQMNKNIQQITQQLERQRTQLAKRNKQLQKKELLLNKQNKQLFSILQSKSKEIQQKTIKNLLSIEEEIKKRVKQLTISLKNKQKQVTEKILTMRQNLKKVKDLQTQEKSINQKLKLLQKKQKQRKLKQANDKQQQQSVQQSNKRLQQLNTKISLLQQTNKKLQDEIQKLSKKIKTNQMANKHYQNQTEKKMSRVNEMTERIKVLQRENEEKQKILEQTQTQLQEEKRNKVLIQRQLKEMGRKLMVCELKIREMQKQNLSLLCRIDHLTKKQVPFFTSSSIGNNNNNMVLPQFQQLDISKIGHQQWGQQQKWRNNCNRSNNMRQQKQQQEISIIHQVGESFFNMGDKNVQKMSTFKDFLRESLLQQQQQSIDLQREKNYFKKNGRFKVQGQIKKQKLIRQKALKQEIIKQKAIKQEIIKKYKSDEQNKYIQQSQRLLSLEEGRNNKLKQQQQQQQQLKQQGKQQILISQQQNVQNNPNQQHSKLGQSNIVLFDNYFNTKSKPNHMTNSTNNNNNSGRKQSLVKKKNISDLIEQNDYFVHNYNDDNKSDNKLGKYKNIVSSRIAEQLGNSHHQILSQINAILNPFNSINNHTFQCHSLDILCHDTLIKWITSLRKQLKYSKSLIQPLLELLLTVLQPCTCTYHTKSLTLLFTPQLVNFLQQTFLKFQALVPTIEQKAIIILSRILLSYQNSNQKKSNFILTPSYLKSLKVKLLIQKDSFILSNINFLINYQ